MERKSQSATASIHENSGIIKRIFVNVSCWSTTFLIFFRQSLILSKEFFDHFPGDIICYDTLIKRPRQVFQVFFEIRCLSSV